MTVQTFSVNYYAKKVISLPRLEHAAAESCSIRALSRLFKCSCGTVVRRMRREMFTKRAFLSFLDLLPIDLKIWSKIAWYPKKGGLAQGPLPAFAFG